MLRLRIRKLAINAAISCILVAVLQICLSPIPAAGQDDADFETSSDTNSYPSNDPVLQRAFLSFEAHDLDGGGKLLVQFVASKKAEYTNGYTFGFDAAEETLKHLTNSDAITVISRFATNYTSAADLPIKEGIDAVLLQCYVKADDWSAGTGLLTSYKGLKKSNYLLNLYALNFIREMIVSGQTNSANTSSRSYFGDWSNIDDAVQPVGYWLSSWADTEVMAGDTHKNLEVLSLVQRASPDYFKSNEVSIILKQVAGFEEIKQISSIQPLLARAFKLQKEGLPLSEFDRQQLKHKLEFYQKSDYLDTDYAVVPPGTGGAIFKAPSISKASRIWIRVFVFGTSLLGLCVLIFSIWRQKFKG